MKIGMLGTGPVGINIATKLVKQGHQVRMGSRDPENPEAAKWARRNGKRASHGTFSEAAKFGDIIFNCTNGAHSIEALRKAGERNLRGKVLIDLANPLKFSKKGEMTLFIGNTDSLGEKIQRTFPSAKVVKTLNTVNMRLHTNPSLLPGEHSIFMSGNDKQAKAKVARILKGFGWKSIIDLGGIKSARGQEALLLFWWHLNKRFPNEPFNYRIVRRRG
ncbi:MAG: NAD(P)-binding domain-containing protein [Candidatus Micrarchaeota archaeon]|nr:NAD(P)-binding domain-containing protein [Candidatus Micrarchaeota archaeon]